MCLVIVLRAHTKHYRIKTRNILDFILLFGLNSCNNFEILPVKQIQVSANTTS